MWLTKNKAFVIVAMLILPFVSVLRSYATLRKVEESQIDMELVHIGSTSRATVMNGVAVEPTKAAEVDSTERHGFFNTGATFAAGGRPNRSTKNRNPLRHPGRSMRKSPKHNTRSGLAETASTGEQRIIYFMHIHKCAGSTMCQAAWANAIPVLKAANCNVQKDQRCCGKADTVAAHKLFARTTQLRFVAAEREMYDTMDTEHYRYVTVLRKSHDRYISHFKHVVRESKYNGTFADWWNFQADNFGFRKFCGPKCSKVSKYHITESLFNYTIDRIHKFEDFLFVENFTASFSQFATRVGWFFVPYMGKNTAPLVNESTYPDLSAWDPLMSALEDALYEYALQRFSGSDHPVFSEEVRRGLREYFVEGPLRNCDRPCCAETCSVYR